MSNCFLLIVTIIACARELQCSVTGCQHIKSNNNAYSNPYVNACPSVGAASGACCFAAWAPTLSASVVGPTAKKHAHTFQQHSTSLCMMLLRVPCMAACGAQMRLGKKQHRAYAYCCCMGTYTVGRSPGHIEKWAY